MAPKPVYQKLNSEDVEDDENENLTPNATTISTEPIPQSPQGETTTPESTNQAAGNTEELNDAPPPYEPASGETANLITPAAPTSQEDLLNLSPPLYSEIVKLPTYNESQNIESDNEEPQGLNRIRLFFVSRGEEQEVTADSIGTDVGFILCFLMAFIFNGLGFLVAYCSTNTLSSHYGAFSGFGLSLVKWAFIVKHRGMLKEYFEGNDWLLYCIVLLGWMIFMKGMFSYAQLKRAMVTRRPSDEENVE